MLSYVFLAFATICAAVTAFGFDSKIYLFDAKGAFPVLIGSNAHYHLKVPRIKSRSSTYQHILHSSRANFNELISVVDEISMSDRLPEIIIANDSQIESSVENLTLKSNTSQINGNTLEILSFEVLGDPIPLARHRVSRGIMYNPAAKLQKQFAEKCSMYLPNEPLTGPLKAEIIFYFKRPLNHYRTGKMAHILKDNMDIWHVKKKDLDNLVKFVLDSLNGKAFEDDSQICVLSSAKLFTEKEPKTLIIITKLTDEDANQYIHEI